MKHILFPVGHLEKPDVRKLAQKFKLPNADKKDSQGLCFIGKVDMKEFLSHYIETTQGNVLNEKGEIIGIHPGALLFTIGERHGFTITKKSPHDQAYYVRAKNISKNEITVASQHVRIGHEVADQLNSTSDIHSVGMIKDASAIKILNLTQTNWIGSIPKVGMQVSARSRYRQTLEIGKITNINSDTAQFEFNSIQETIAAGQSLVIYDGDICLGGGIIA